MRATDPWKIFSGDSQMCVGSMGNCKCHMNELKVTAVSLNMNRSCPIALLNRKYSVADVRS